MNDPMQIKESVNKFRELLDFLEKKVQEINTNSKGQEWLRAVWNMLIPDLIIFTECIHVFGPDDFKIIINKKKLGQQLNVSLDKAGLANLSRHIKRAYIIETYSIIEHYFWQLKSGLETEIKGMMSSIEKDIDEALNLLSNNDEVKEILNKAKDKCRRTKPDLLTVMSAVLKHKKIERKERRKWREFFNGFRIIRNSIHNNMIAKEDYDEIFPNEWYPYEVKKGKPINPTCELLMNIAERCSTFFDEVQL